MIDFPVAPFDGYTFVATNGVVYKWQATPGIWLAFDGPPPVVYTINVMEFIPGSLLPDIIAGTSTVDVTPYLQAAINSGVRDIYFPAGKYRLTGDSSRLIHPGNQRWRGAGAGKTIIEKDGAFGIVRAMGSIDPATTYTLATDMAAGSILTQLSTGQAANFAVGNVVQIVDETFLLSGNGNPLVQKQGEFVTIVANYQPQPPTTPIVYPADTISFRTPIQYNFAVANQARLVKYNWLYGVEITDMSFTHLTYPQGNAAMVYCGACFEPRIIGCSAYHGMQQGFAFGGCYNARADVQAHDLKSGVDADGSSFGYGILEAGPNAGGQFNVNAHRVRHAYTTGGNLATSSPKVDTPYGIPMSSVVTGVASDTHMSAWDTHPEGYNILFNGCIANGAGHSGVQMRCRQGSAVGCQIDRTVGAGVFIPASGLDAYIADCVMTNTNNGINDEDLIDWREHGAIEDYGIRSHINGALIRQCGGPGINTLVNTKDAVYRNITINDPCRFTTTNKNGITAGAMASTTLRIDNIDITCIDANMQYGIVATTASLVGLITGARISGTPIAPMQIGAAMNVWGSLINGPVSFGTQKTVAIVGGVLDLTNVTTGLIGILPSVPGSPDNLRTILSNTLNHTILIRKAGTSSENITLKEFVSSPDNIFTSTAADLVMGSSTKVYMLTKLLGTNWTMLSVT